MSQIEIFKLYFYTIAFIDKFLQWASNAHLFELCFSQRQ